MEVVASELIDLDPFDLLDRETTRLDRYFSSRDEEDWSEPTRCEGWSVRDVLAHLAGNEMYNRAGLDGELEGLLAKATEAGVNSIDDFNEWMVNERAAEPVTEVLQEWRDGSADTRARLRARGLDGELIMIVGPYPAGLQAFHLASEAATHADDVDAPVGPEERAGRVAWRARFSRFALKEKDPSLAVDSEVGRNRLRVGDREAELSDEDLVEAAVARLAGEHPLSTEVRGALRCLA